MARYECTSNCEPRPWAVPSAVLAHGRSLPGGAGGAGGPAGLWPLDPSRVAHASLALLRLGLPHGWLERAGLATRGVTTGAEAEQPVGHPTGG